MKFTQLLSDRVVVRPDCPEDKTKGGILLPDGVKEKPRTGYVIAVGPGKILESGKRSEMTVKVGDYVAFTIYSGAKFEINTKEHLVMTEPEIIGILDPEGGNSKTLEEPISWTTDPDKII